jgi:hypothetical protein
VTSNEKCNFGEEKQRREAKEDVEAVEAGEEVGRRGR